MPWGAWEVNKAVQTAIQSPVASEQVVITAPSTRFDLAQNATLFEGGVTLTWGVTVITADRLEVRDTPDGRRGRAEGRVRLTDPDGTLQAENLDIEWDTQQVLRRASAGKVLVVLAGTRVRASSMSITPEEWRFENVAITNCRLNRPFYEVETPLLVVTPGEKGRATRPRFSMLGKQIATLPNVNFNLDRRVQGFRLPGIELRPQVGLGIVWRSEFLLDKQTSVQGLIGAFERFQPNFGVNVTRSFEKNGSDVFMMTPRSDTLERFQFGFFEAIDVLGPAGERRFVSARRNSLSFSSNFNEVPEARQSLAPISRVLDLTYEQSGEIGKFAHISQLRAQNVREREDPFVQRGIASTSLLMPQLSLGKDLKTYSRFDASVYGSQRIFGWNRLTAGIVYEPKPYLQLSAALTGGYEFGTPDFDSDRLLSRNAAILRMDYSLGPRRFSAMTRYDAQLRWYTTEFAATQSIGCVDLFVLSRRMPREYRIGIRLRLDNFLNLFGSRQTKRGPNGSFFSNNRKGPR